MDSKYTLFSSQVLKTAKNPMIILGSGALQRADGTSLHALTSRLAQDVRVGCGCGEDWKVLNVLHRVGLT